MDLMAAVALATVVSGFYYFMFLDIEKEFDNEQGK